MTTKCIYCSDIFDSENDLNKHFSICKSIKELLDNMSKEMREELEKQIIKQTRDNNSHVYNECFSGFNPVEIEKHTQQCIRCQIGMLKGKLSFLEFLLENK